MHTIHSNISPLKAFQNHLLLIFLLKYILHISSYKPFDFPMPKWYHQLTTPGSNLPISTSSNVKCFTMSATKCIILRPLYFWFNSVTKMIISHFSITAKWYCHIRRHVLLLNHYHWLKFFFYAPFLSHWNNKLYRVLRTEWCL